MKQYGLIGKSLKHSFSKNYFSDKFKVEGIDQSQYDLFELPEINQFPNLIQRQKGSLVGLNVTIPYKKEVMGYLDELDRNAREIGAVNTIKVEPNGQLKGYNTDYNGFMTSLKDGWDLKGKKALILGTGGASQAVKKVLRDLHIEFKNVSRNAVADAVTYEELSQNEMVAQHHLIINTTPLGTFPNLEEKPALPYQQLTSWHLLFDLVYNPETTAFMQQGIARQAQVKNGYQMLVGQAEEAWKIWNK